MAQFNNTIYSNAKLLVDYLKEKAAGKTFKMKGSLIYSHGKMVKIKVTNIREGYPGTVFPSVDFIATFSDGYKAEYNTLAHGFYADHYQEF
jgi:hypothetical protein